MKILNDEVRREQLREQILTWDKQSARELMRMVREFWDRGGDEINIDDIPTYPIPEEVLNVYFVWAMDVKGDVLIGAGDGDLKVVPLVELKREIALTEVEAEIAKETLEGLGLIEKGR